MKPSNDDLCSAHWVDFEEMGDLNKPWNVFMVEGKLRTTPQNDIPENGVVVKQIMVNGRIVYTDGL